MPLGLGYAEREPALRASPERLHHFDSETGDFVGQRGPTFSYQIGGATGSFRMPISIDLLPFSQHRLLRRLGRVDTGTCLPLAASNSLFVFWMGSAYVFDTESETLERTVDFDFRSPLHGGVAARRDGSILLGEYFSNSDRRPVRVYASGPGAREWDVLFEFAAGDTYHIHGVATDPFDESVWVYTGDLDGECRLLRSADNFRTLDEFGDGSQSWRAASLLFTEDSIVWGMDSPVSACRVMRLDRKTGQLEARQEMPGPVWHSKQLADGQYLMQSSVEQHGQAGVQSRSATLFVSSDLDQWEPVVSFRKDRLSHRYFRHGVLAFSNGHQTSDRFAISGQALRGFDGEARVAGISYSK